MVVPWSIRLLRFSRPQASLHLGPFSEIYIYICMYFNTESTQVTIKKKEKFSYQIIQKTNCDICATVLTQ